jgi:catecholate siderophore receptor
MKSCRITNLLSSTSPIALLAPVFGFALSSVATPAAAQSNDGPVQLPTISVQERQVQPSYQSDQSSLPKLTQPMLDTPQSVDTVPQQLMQDQGVATLRDALRNVAGISLAAGEAGAQGDNLTLRGFTARNDIFIDGMRDFGSYYRDPFYLDSIEVLKGPASILFGRGSTGGVIEQNSKMPGLGSFANGSLAFGTDMKKRVTADVNQPLTALGQGAAFRLNFMAHDSNVAGRDAAENSRFGFAPTLALGLGTPTRINFSYLHQTEYDTPDYGLPWIYSSGVGAARGIAVPAPVNGANFYGFSNNDFLRTNVDVATAKIEHDLNDSITLRDQARFAHYVRQFRITEPQIYATAAPGASGAAQLITPGTSLGAINVSRNQLYGTSLETFAQNQADVTAKFDTFFVNHTLVTGFEIGEETSDPRRYSTIGPFSTTSLVSPNSGQIYNASTFFASNTRTDAKTLAYYALDTLKLSEQWQLLGGIRLDRFAANYYQQTFNSAGAPSGYTALNHTNDMASWRAGIVYKPAPNGSVYFAAGTSFNPSAESLSLTAATAILAPVKNKSYEVGTKWDVLNEKLTLRSAIYRTEQQNVREPDPNNSNLQILAGNARVDGIEFEAVGHMTEKWQVYAGYNYMYSAITKSPVQGAGSDIGNHLANVPAHTFSLWTTYELPAGFEVGAGVKYVSSRYANSTPRFICSPAVSTCTAATAGATAFLNKVTGYTTFDAMAKYYVNEKLDLQLNIYNITDEYYLDGLHPSHVIPGPGRTALLTINYKY